MPAIGHPGFFMDISIHLSGLASSDAFTNFLPSCNLSYLSSGLSDEGKGFGNCFGILLQIGAYNREQDHPAFAVYKKRSRVG